MYTTVSHKYFVRAALFDYHGGSNAWLGRLSTPDKYNYFYTAQNDVTSQDQVLGDEICAARMVGTTEPFESTCDVSFTRKSNYGGTLTSLHRFGFSSSRSLGPKSSRCAHRTFLYACVTPHFDGYVKHVVYQPNAGTESEYTNDIIRSGSIQSNQFTRTGYTFVNWNTKADGTGTTYNEGDVITVDESTKGQMTLYAQWVPNSYTVNFNKQGGTDGSDNVIATFDAAMPQIATPTRSGYGFYGYFSEPNGNGTRYYDIYGTSTHAWDVAEDNVTLYACWGTPVSYIDADGSLKYVGQYEPLTNGTTTLSRGWYLVTGTVTTNTLVCEGDVKIILADGAKLTATGDYDDAGIRVSAEGASLTIYGQQNQTGQLIATGYFHCAGIGGAREGSGHDITINGGVITANGGPFGSGIGGGNLGTGHNITINGGVITANGGLRGAGIGGGDCGTGHNITINGGTVTATGGESAAGIGGGFAGNGSDITINGGVITAVGGTDASGIGGGFISSNIFVHSSLVLYAGNTNPPTDFIAHTNGVDVSDRLSGKQYVIARKQEESITITFDMQGGTGGTEQITMNEFTEMPDISVPERDGYAFVGYFSGENGTGTKYYTADGTSAHYLDFNTNKTLYAYWDLHVPYIDADGYDQIANNVTKITNTSSTLNAGWYVVNGEVSTAGLVCNGAVHLILADGATLTATAETGYAGIEVSDIYPDAAITIYGQTAQTGKLIATGASGAAGIGGGSGDVRCNGQNITINGGIIAAKSLREGAGIGGGKKGYGRHITINRGVIIAESQHFGSAIGGGAGGSDIHIAGNLLVRAGDSESTTEIIPHGSEDMATALAGKLYASIEPVAPMTVTLDMQGGEGGTASLTATYGSAMPTITLPTRTGYTFQGYFAESNGQGTKYYNSDGTSAHTWDIASNTSLYAYWTGNTYAVTFDKQDGTGGTTSVTATYDAAMPAITLPTRTGYTFLGYFTETNGAGAKYYNADGSSAHVWDLMEDKTLYAYWTVNQYTITLDLQGGEGGTTSVTATYGAAMPAITLPTRTGYAFGGYFSEAEGAGTQYYNADGTSAQVCDFVEAKTLYAHWIACIPYIDADGTTKYVSPDDVTEITNTSSTLNAGWYVVKGTNVRTNTLVCNGAVHLILADGAKLIAAKAAETEYDPGIQVSGDDNSLTIYGQTAQSGQLIAYGGYWGAGIGGGFEQSGSHITINGGVITAKGGKGEGYAAGIGGGYGGDGHDITINGGKVIATGGVGTSAIGAGWNGSASNIFVNAELTMRADDNYPPTTIIRHTTDQDVTTLLVGKQYVVIDDAIIVNFDKQGGIGTASVAAMHDADMPEIDIPIRGGYSFQGYFTEPNGAGTQYYNADGTSAHVCDFAAETTLYAYWQGNKATITFDMQGGKGGTATVVATFDADMPEIIIPTHEVFAFGGYFEQPNGVGTKYYNADGTSAHTWNISNHTTLYAQWKKVASYVDVDGTTKYIGIDGEFTDDPISERIILYSGWYLVSGSDLQAGTFTCEGDVHLILADGSKLTATGIEKCSGVVVSSSYPDASLTIYGQENQSGQLIAIGGSDSRAAGIGGEDGYSGCHITINGGIITAIGQSGAAGIGGGMGKDGFDITINGGTITATGGWLASGIGGGTNGKGYDITINGGVVVAKGSDGAAGIGGGYEGDGHDITINGGAVTATTVYDASGIGAGFNGNSSNIFVDEALLLRAGVNKWAANVIEHTSTGDQSLALANQFYVAISPGVVLPLHYAENMAAWYGTFYDGTHAYEVNTLAVTLYTASLETYGSETFLNLHEINGNILPAGIPVIVCSRYENEVVLTEYIGSTTDVAVPANSLSGTDVDLTVAANTVYTLAAEMVEGVNTLAYYKFGGTEIPAHKAYLQLPAGTPAPRRIGFGSHTTTGVENTEVVSIEKILRNGQLLIRKNGHLYNMQGAELK